jgi:DNA invertase Pin-like site-specific DNA recombinase
MSSQRLGIGCVRVSSDRQERSIDAQKESIRAAAVRSGIKLLEGDMWCEDEGVSGSILDRPGLRKLLTLCRTRTDVTDIYFWKRNRLTRSIDPLDGMNIEREIEKSGKKIHFVQGIQKTGHRLLDFIASGLEYAEAGQYLVNISADTIRGLVPLTKAGYDAGRPTPYGFDRLVVDKRGNPQYKIRNICKGIKHKIMPSGEIQVYDNGERPTKDKSAHSTLILGEAVRIAVVRRIFESYVYSEMGIRAITEQLNIEGIPSPTGGTWSVGTIRSILVNPVYYGANVWNIRNFSKYHSVVDGRPMESERDRRKKRFNDPKDWIIADENNGFPAIVSKELFEQARKKRESRNVPHLRGRAVAAPYYLSGLAVCSCGNKLQGQALSGGKKKRHERYYYYTCGGYMMKGRSVCYKYLIPRDQLEKPILDALARRLRALGSYDSIRDKVKEALKVQTGPNILTSSIIERKIGDVDKAARNWETAIDRGLNVEVAIEKINQLAKEKETLHHKLEEELKREKLEVDIDKVSEELMQSLSDFHEVLANGSIAEVKAVLRAYIGRIDIDLRNKKARVGFYRLPTRVASRTELDYEKVKLIH